MLRRLSLVVMCLHSLIVVLHRRSLRPAVNQRSQTALSKEALHPIALLVVVGGVVVVVDHQLHLPRLNSVAYMIAMCRQCRQCR